MAYIEGGRPTVNLSKQHEVQPETRRDPVVSRDGTVFHRRNSSSGEILVARDGNELGRRPTFSAARLEGAKIDTDQSDNATGAAIVSENGDVFDRRNTGRGEVLVVRGGNSSTARPTFKMPEGSASRMPPKDIEDID